MTDKPGSGSIKHYMFLDGLRGAAAFYVMVYHLLAWAPSVLPHWMTRLQKPLSFGHVAVSVFIVLSGYSLGLPVARSTGHVLRGGVWAYLTRRARRILPAYLLATVIAIVISLAIGPNPDIGTSAADLSLGSISTHLLLIHNLWKSYSSTLNVAHWSVAAEWQIYFIFPTLLLPAWRLWGRFGLIATGFVLAAVPILLLPTGRDLWWSCPWYIGLFAVGAAASTFEQIKFSAAALRGILATAIALCVVYTFVHHELYRVNQERPLLDFVKDSIAGLAVAMMLAYLVAKHDSTGRHFLIRWLESQPLRWVGARSYSLYLIHCSVLTLCLWVASEHRLSSVNSFLLRIYLGIPASLAAASLLYWVGEKPFMSSRPALVDARVQPPIGPAKKRLP